MLEEIGFGDVEIGPPVDLVGLCQGGWMALVYAARFPGKVRIRCVSDRQLTPETSAAFYGVARRVMEIACGIASCSEVEILVKSTRYGPVIEVRNREAGVEALGATYSRSDPGLLLLEHQAARDSLGLRIALERDKGLLVRAWRRQ